MAALFLLVAIFGGVVVGDLVLENPSTGDITILNYTISGYSEGLLLAAAAALGFVVGLLVVASASTTRTRRARRKQLRTAGRDLNTQVAELKRENTWLREELAGRDRPVRHRGEPASPADLGSTPWTGSAVDRGVTVPSQRLAERHPEPLYEEAKRAARLRGDPDLSLLLTDDHARHRPTNQYARRS
jgi:outer membrane murein-binding lipoprotein Lpp